jgi:hypothetical protein
MPAATCGFDVSPATESGKEEPVPAKKKVKKGKKAKREKNEKGPHVGKKR